MEFIKNIAARFGSSFFIISLSLIGIMTFSSYTNYGELQKDGYRTFSSAFDLKFTRVERVGSVLIADFTLKNKSGKDIRNFNIRHEDARDNKRRYDSDALEIRFRQSNYSHYATTTLAKDETVTGTFRISGFDASCSADKVKLFFRCSADEANINPSSIVSTSDLDINEDKRVRINGIQSNDLNVDYILERTYQKGTDVYITFRLRNRTGNTLEKLELDPNYAFFGNNETSNGAQIITGNMSDYSWHAVTDVNPGGTATYTIRVSYVKSRVSSMTVDVFVSSFSYVFADELLRIISVPVPYSR